MNKNGIPSAEVSFIEPSTTVSMTSAKTKSFGTVSRIPENLRAAKEAMAEGRNL